ncbi:MAG: acyltransferase [bacterium]|jgi:acetyltransferase-like isoleucine patch superfamily enzyme
MRNYQTYPVPPGKNSLHYWPQAVSYRRVIFNFLIIQVCRYSPSFWFKNLLYRHLLGMKVGKNAAIGLMVMVDVFFPQEISVGENTIIGYNCTLLGHEFLQTEWRRGPVKIGRNVLIGANTTVLPGVTIGDGAIVSACSLVNKDVPPGAKVGGVPVKALN